jgi:hypothetical protein
MGAPADDADRLYAVESLGEEREESLSPSNDIFGRIREPDLFLLKTLVVKFKLITTPYV